MRSGRLASGAMMFVACATPARTAPAGTSGCESCHPAISRSFQRTAMAKSFFRPAPENTIEDYTNKHTFYHSPSDLHFEMIERDGRYFQRQYQVGFEGKQTNILETRIDFVLGSGSHARTYLHRTGDNRLIELPLGWYAEKGGYWAMNPGYDRPDHQGVERAIGYDCMFCHNAYPRIPAGGPRSEPVFSSVPEGIGCQRCHGDARDHMRIASEAGSAAQIRGAIVNPARLPFDRQIEICMQCHLETTSFSTANSIVRYEREPFSFKPGEILADFRLHFDHNGGDQDRFEIVGAAYRLRQSQCFRKSALTCTTCHNPHTAQESADHYTAACRQCHAAKLDALVQTRRHPASTDCAGCHMPKRRTQDAVHVIMTDHLIQRRKPASDLLAEIAERPRADYRGAIVPYFPDALTRPQDELYLGVAQANDSATRTEGIARLSATIAKFHPAAAEYYLQLGDALRASGRFAEAIAPYEEAVRREPQSALALERLGLGLTRVKRFADADAVFKDALRLAPGDARMWTHRATSYLEQDRIAEAAAAFEKALAIDPQIPEAHNGLAGARMKSGDAAGAEAEFRAAIAIRPNYTEAHHNLANVLSAASRFPEARYHFEQTLHLKETHADARLDYARMLVRANLPDDARRQLEILRADPRYAKAAREILQRIH